MNFTPKQVAEHLRLLAICFYNNMNETPDECNALGLDGKKPFGNSSYPGDVCEIIGLEPEDLEGGFRVWSDQQYKYGRELFNSKLGPYLSKHGHAYFTSLKS